MGTGVVVVVDANPGALVVSRNILARAGYEVHTAPDPDEACSRIRTAGPDVLLLDAAYAWPHVLGQLEAASFVRVPVVLVAPAGMGQVIASDLADDGVQNIAGVIEKPFLSDALTCAVRDAVLDCKQTRQLEIRGPVTLDTLQETLDAESACDLLGVRPVVEVSPVDEPDRDDRLDLIREVRSALELDGTPPPPDVLMSGRIGDITVPHLLQFAEGLSVTAMIRLRCDEQRFVVTLQERHVVGARRGLARRDVDDAEACLQIVGEALALTDGTFSVERRERVSSLIRLPLAAVLLDGLRRQDEALLRLDATIETPRRVPMHS
ncbi:MAG: DUF4388 domain-containing protein [Deltaproteobacteria bacterium]|jgi:CheY-like chemotaxis protein